jgi:multidrug efflux pump subunit AcrA (membrane-fusion protein)
MTRNFLEDRKIAKKTVEAGKLKEESLRLKVEAAKAKIEEATKKSEELLAEAELRSAEAELAEYLAHQDQLDDGTQHLDEEIEYLTKLEAEYAAEAEKSRIEGKSDHEMYDINAAYEVYARNMKAIEEAFVANTLQLPREVVTESMRTPALATRLRATTKIAHLRGDINNLQGQITYLSEQARSGNTEAEALVNKLLPELEKLNDEVAKLEPYRIDPTETMLLPQEYMDLNQKLLGVPNNAEAFLSDTKYAALVHNSNVSNLLENKQ